MRFRRIGLVAVIGLAVAVPGVGTAQATGQHHHDDAIVIAHRGASGYRPEHTLGAYKLAIEQGADSIEPDVVSTKDGVLVARHENEISGTTDVAAHGEFLSRRTTKTIDGVAVTGWFTEDFTLAELKTLRAKERLPELRPGNTAYDGQYEIPTLQEVIDLVKRESRRHHRQIGIAPETKHPTYFTSIGLPLEKPLVRVLRRNGLDHRRSKVVIQSFEVGNLVALSKQTKVELAQLVNASGKPYDFVVSGDPRTYSDLITPAGLKAMSTYADWVAPEKSRIIPRDASGALLQPTTLVRDAHRAGLRVVTWTFRAENSFLPADFRNGTDPAAHGDLVGEIQTFLGTGLDAFFTDFPDLGVEAVEDF
jgi:glycerophosphoryl diester phosphodiesterase